MSLELVVGKVYEHHTGKALHSAAKLIAKCYDGQLSSFCAAVVLRKGVWLGRLYSVTAGQSSCVRESRRSV